MKHQGQDLFGAVVFSGADAGPRGGIPNGTVVMKVNSETGDGHVDGDTAEVVGSLGPVEFSEEEVRKHGAPPGINFGYWVLWEDGPQVPVFIAGHRLKTH